MKILMLCNKSPWPKREGGPIAMHAMISGLLESGHSVKVLAANTNKYNVDPDSIPVDFKQKTGIEFVDIDLSLSVWGALYNFFAGKSYHVSRFHTKDFEQKIIEVLRKESYDIIQLEMLQMATYLDIIRKFLKEYTEVQAIPVDLKQGKKIRVKKDVFIFLPFSSQIRLLYLQLQSLLPAMNFSGDNREHRYLSGFLSFRLPDAWKV